MTAYPTVRRIPWQVDLAVIATPAHIVPQVVEECGESGISGIVIVSSGFGETGPGGKALEEELLRLKRSHGLRIVGPNCLGVMHPRTGLNATFANRRAAPGKIAFVSQSGALCASVLDWAAHARVGFSYFVSVGGMIDVDFADLIDYFGVDPETRSIVLFIEAVREPRKFMSAARRFAGTKPIIAVKTGRSPEGARVAESHTGAIAGEDAIYDSFFSRAGVVRAEEVADLFNCSEVLSMQPSPRGTNLAIITNAGGPAVMATDALIARGGGLAALSEEILRSLDAILPRYWSRSNPIDICEDATVDRFGRVLEICFKDPNADGHLVIYTPIGAADPTETARRIIEASRETRKPLLTCWLGEEDVREARRILRHSGIPTCPTPEQAVATFMYMNQYARNLELLYEPPEELPIVPSAEIRSLRDMIHSAEGGTRTLTEPESKRLLEAYGIATARAHVARTADEAVDAAFEIGYPVAMKILSPQVTHKTDIDGVILNIASDQQVRSCYRELVDRAMRRLPSAEVEGVTVQPMITGGYELIIGAKRDPQFGSVLIFGTGGVGVELFKDISVGFPPLNQTLARRMIEASKAHRILSEGYRGRPPANIRLLEEALVRFSQLIVDYPQIREADVNPLLADEDRVVALDARIMMDTGGVSARVRPHEHLIISPYPTRYLAIRTLRGGEEALLRPIKPEDEPFLVELFRTFSEETMRLRFFHVIGEISHRSLARYCNIDYDREMTIISELRESGGWRMAGMASLVVQPDGESGEVAVVVGDPWQNRGLGTEMFDYIVEVGRSMGLRRVFGEILARNTKMMHIAHERGFGLRQMDEENYMATLDL